MSRLPHGWPDENVEPSAGIDCRWSNLEADDEGSTEAKHRMLRGVACLCEHPGKPRLACPGALCDPQCRTRGLFLSLELGLTVRSAVSRVEERDVDVGDGDDPCHPAFSSPFPTVRDPLLGAGVVDAGRPRVCVLSGRRAESSRVERLSNVDPSLSDRACRGRGRLALFGVTMKLGMCMSSTAILGHEAQREHCRAIYTGASWRSWWSWWLGETGKRVPLGIFAICRALRMMLLPHHHLLARNFACLPYARLTPSISPPPQCGSRVRRGQGRIGRRRRKWRLPGHIAPLRRASPAFHCKGTRTASILFSSSSTGRARCGPRLPPRQIERQLQPSPFDAVASRHRLTM